MFNFTLRKKSGILLLILIGLVVYFNALFNDFIIGDDEDQIIYHTQVHSVVNIPKFFSGSTYHVAESNKSYGLFYRPLMLSVYTIIYSLFGPDPLFFHLIQIALHITNALLVYFLFRHFFSDNISFFSALIFLVHPINSETVLHIANMQDTLFLLFGLSAFLLVLTKKKLFTNWLYYLYLGILLLLALLAKETGLLFLAMAVIYVFLFEKQLFKAISTTTIISTGVYLYLRFVIADISSRGTSIAQISHASFFTRLLNMPKIIFTYLATFIFPRTLVTTQFWMIKAVDLSNFYFPLAIVVVFFTLLGITSFFLYRKGGKIAKFYLFFTIWFVIGLAMHSQIIPLELTVAERWFYFPIIGLLGLLAIIVTRVRLKNDFVKKVVLVSLFLITITLAARTIIRTFDWRSSITLLTHDVPLLENNYYLENNLGTLYIREHQYDLAKPWIKSSVQAYPYFGNLNNMAIIYAQENQLEKAQEYFEKSISKGGNVMVFHNYANFLLMTKDYQTAQELASKGVIQYPNSGLLWLVLAQSSYLLEQQELALQAAEKALNLIPEEEVAEVYTIIKEKQELILENKF